MENITLYGRSTLKAYPAGTGFKGEPAYQNTVNNRIMARGRQLVARFLNNESVGDGLTYHAIGSGDSTPQTSQLTLDDEEARKQWTVTARTGSVVLFEVFYLASESQYEIAEAGVFGDNATAAADSGIIFSRYLQSFDNSAGSFDLTFEYELTIGAV